MTTSATQSNRSPLRILHTNDLHGALTAERAASLAPIRADHDLYFDTGDLVKAGNLSVPLKPDTGWDHLAELNCTASVIGNRETQVKRGPFQRKIAGNRHPVLCGNMVDKAGQLVLPACLQMELGGWKVGVLAVSVAMVTARMKTAPMSDFLWEHPVRTAVELAAKLRESCDVVVALTHIGIGLDRELAAATDDIDFILGGHSHTVLEQPEMVAGTPIAQGGSHGRFYGSYQWDGATLSGGLHPWP